VKCDCYLFSLHVAHRYLGEPIGLFRLAVKKRRFVSFWTLEYALMLLTVEVYHSEYEPSETSEEHGSSFTPNHSSQIKHPPNRSIA
jgi:hypothetical protein